jgi:hypothetical protein
VGFQTGTNTATIVQSGTAMESALISQAGQGNFASAFQSGNSSTQDQISISQLGNNNSVIAVQTNSGGSNRITVVQN